ncbi:FAD-dependent oxidoreductase [Pseudomonas sp. DSP3-2-2]|uniref:FAD-dependent oxidoreductase n=1 Tax=unclassified Pseudomonas TaxID=196821 RepID=UPI003CE9E051
MNESVDLLIIGAGPAGLAAALAAAPSGARIALLDDNPLPGGQIWRDGPQADIPAQARSMRDEIQAFANISRYSASKVIARGGPRQLLVENAERGWLISYEKLILCTGARELLLPFPGWTLPGVTGAGGLQALIKGGLSVKNQRVVIAGSGPLLLASAATANAKGAQVLRIAEQASMTALAGFAASLWQWPNKAWQAIGLIDAQYRPASHVIAALGTNRLEAVRVQTGQRSEEIPCERLACGFGLVPNVELAQALGCQVIDRAIVVDEWQATRLEHHYAAGECTGFGGSELALVEGRIAGLAAMGWQQQAQALWPQRQRWQRFADALRRSFALAPAIKNLAEPETLVCRCEDVSYAALAEHCDWKHAKLATRCGMGACQGRICSTATQTLFGWEPPVARPPFSPARVETLMELDSLDL